MSIKLTTAGKLQLIMDLLGGQPVYDDTGQPTGEKTPQFINEEEAKQLLEFFFEKNLGD